LFSDGGHTTTKKFNTQMKQHCEHFNNDVSEDFVCVIDGATSNTTKLYNGRKSGLMEGMQPNLRTNV
jgi:hypothetical protein